MKIYQVFLLAAIFGQTRGECQCGVFMMGSEEIAKEEVYLNPTFQQGCERLEMDQVCRDFCFEHFMNLTAKGDLSAVSFVFNVTGGEFFCNRLNKTVFNEDLAGFYRWCQTSWKFIGLKANDKFCCNAEGTFFRCNEFEESVSITTPTNPDHENATTLEDSEPAVITEIVRRRDIDIDIEVPTTDRVFFDGKSITDEPPPPPFINDTDVRFDRRSVGNKPDDSAANSAGNATAPMDENNVRQTLTKRDIAEADVISIKTGRRHPSTFRLLTTSTTETSIANHTTVDDGQEQPGEAVRLDFVANNVTADE